MLFHSLSILQSGPVKAVRPPLLPPLSHAVGEYPGNEDGACHYA